MRTWLRSILTTVSGKNENSRRTTRYRPMLELLETRDLMASGLPIVSWSIPPIQLPGEAFKTGQKLYLDSSIDLWDAPSYQSAVTYGLRLSADSTVNGNDKLVYTRTVYGTTGVGNIFTPFNLPPGGDAFWSNAGLGQNVRTFWIGLFVTNGTTGATTWYGTESFDVKPGIYATFNSQTGLLKVVGTDASEALTVRNDGGISVDTVNIYYTREKVSKAKVVEAVKSIEVYGNGDDDVITVAQSIKANSILWGGAGKDTIRGGSGDDIIHGGGDDDRLFGRAGDDFLYGEADNDWLDAGSAKEYVNFGSGNRDWNAWQWAVNGTKMDDVRQGHQGNCYFLAPLASLAMRGWNLKDRIHYVRPYYYRVDLFGPKGGRQSREVFFDGTLEATDPGNDGAGNWIAAKGEFWVLLFSRAGSGDGGAAGDALRTLTGLPSQNINVWNYTDRAARNRLFNTIERAIKGGGFGGSSIVGQNVIADSWYDYSPFWTVPPNLVGGSTGHSYTVIGVLRDLKTGAPKSITLRNPWGFNPQSGNAYITLQWDFFCDWFRQVWIN